MALEAKESRTKDETHLTVHLNDIAPSFARCNLLFDCRSTAARSEILPQVHIQMKVVEGDTFDAAINLANAAQILNHHDTITCLRSEYNKRDACGWKLGERSNELKKRSFVVGVPSMRPLTRIFIPLNFLVLFIRHVTIFRENMSKNHRWMDLGKTKWLPIISVITMAAIIQLILDKALILPKYKNRQDHELAKDKMRLVLRMAAVHKHQRLVLGGLGCGISRNSKEEVAYCWLKGL